MLYRLLYRLAVFSKRLLAPLLPPAVRQSAKRTLLKLAFPIRQAAEASFNRDSNLREGVNLIGYARAEMGIGESCRIAARSMTAAGVEFGILNFRGTNPARMSDTTWVHKETVQPSFDVNIFHINAEQMTEIYAYFGNRIFDGRYNIGYWHWELSDFPDIWLDGFSFLQEVWVPSTFVADSIALKSPVPVVKIPHSIEVKVEEQRNRAYFKLPDTPFLFLTMYDTKSYQERKNPRASIKAFKQAFAADNDRVGLVIKVNNANSGSEEMNSLTELVNDYRNIHLITEVLSRNDTNALIDVTDCYVSLHRSEGFGLGLAEAMYLSKPVIGTNWSSNTDFMNAGNSCLVDYELVKVGQSHGPYEAYQVWADPDISHAAQYMRRLMEDTEYCIRIAAAGTKTIHDHYSPKVIGELIAKRLAYIHKMSFGG